jgi:hypothetical protein
VVVLVLVEVDVLVDVLVLVEVLVEMVAFSSCWASSKPQCSTNNSKHKRMAARCVTRANLQQPHYKAETGENPKPFFTNDRSSNCYPPYPLKVPILASGLPHIATVAFHRRRCESARRPSAATTRVALRHHPQRHRACMDATPDEKILGTRDAYLRPNFLLRVLANEEHGNQNRHGLFSAHFLA